MYEQNNKIIITTQRNHHVIYLGGGKDVNMLAESVYNVRKLEVILGAAHPLSPPPDPPLPFNNPT